MFDCLNVKLSDWHTFRLSYFHNFILSNCLNVWLSNRQTVWLWDGHTDRMSDCQTDRSELHQEDKEADVGLPGIEGATGGLVAGHRAIWNWTYRPSYCQTISLSDAWAFWLSECLILKLSDCQTVRAGHFQYFKTPAFKTKCNIFIGSCMKPHFVIFSVKFLAMILPDFKSPIGPTKSGEAL